MALLKIILVSILSAVTLFIIAKIMGHKQISQLDLFDYITGITIGSIAAELATDLEAPWKSFTAMIVYGLITIALTTVTNKNPSMRKFINGTPTIIMDDGKLYRKNMKKAKLDLSEFMVLCRQEGYFDLSEIQTAIFEYNGRLTILPVSSKRAVNPMDMNLSPKQDYIGVEVIMDGRILGENLTRMGYDEKWLKKQIALQGYNSVKDVFLGIYNKDKQLSLYPNN